MGQRKRGVTLQSPPALLWVGVHRLHHATGPLPSGATVSPLQDPPRASRATRGGGSLPALAWGGQPDPKLARLWVMPATQGVQTLVNPAQGAHTLAHFWGGAARGVALCLSTKSPKLLGCLQPTWRRDGGCRARVRGAKEPSSPSLASSSSSSCKSCLRSSAWRGACGKRHNPQKGRVLIK